LLVRSPRRLPAIKQMLTSIPIGELSLPAPEAVLQRACVQVGVTYPRPMADLGESRKHALRVCSELI
jgi:hypothetical protein